MKPSPSLFTSKPPLALTCSRMTALCSRRTSMKRESPSRSVSAVDPSMSLNMMVTVPSGAACDLRSGCSASASRATVSIEEPRSLRSIPCAFIFIASERSRSAVNPSRSATSSACDSSESAFSRSPVPLRRSSMSAYASAHRLFQRLQQTVALHLRHLLQQPQSELAADDGADGQHAVALLREVVEPPADDFAHALRNGD